MSKKAISMEELKESMPPGYIYVVDVNSLLGVCGASPVHMYFEADKISVKTLHPRSILLNSGTNDVYITQIKSVVQSVNDDGCDTYEVVCGYPKWVETTVKITKYSPET